MHHAMTNRVDIPKVLDRVDTRVIGSNPAQDMIERRRNILQRRRGLLPRATHFHGNDRFTANAFHNATAKALVGVLFDPVQVSRNNLEFEAGRTSIDDDNVHELLSARAATEESG